MSVLGASYWRSSGKNNETEIIMNKIEHIWTVPCLSSVTDQETNTISLQNVLEQLNFEYEIPNTIDKKPAQISIPINMELVTLWMKSITESDITADVATRFIDPQGQELMQFEHTLTIPNTHQRMRFRVKIKGLQITTNGTYVFEIKIKEPGLSEYRVAGSVPLLITATEKKRA